MIDDDLIDDELDCNVKKMLQIKFKIKYNKSAVRGRYFSCINFDSLWKIRTNAIMLLPKNRYAVETLHCNV